MAKQFLSSIPLLLFILTLSILTPPNNASISQPISKADVGLDNEQLTHLTFYYHNVVAGTNPTSVVIAKATVTDTSPTSFGQLTMIDDLLTEGPEATSKEVGRAQGMYANADLNVNALTMIMNLYFTEGEHNGSTLSVLGRNHPVVDGVQEMPVVGGTGTFRFAKGYVQAETQVFDEKSGDAVMKYDVYVSHANSTLGITGTVGLRGDSGSGASSSSSGSGSGLKTPGSGSSSNNSSAAILGQVSFPTMMASSLVMIGCVLIN